jgi:hypothetical protein
MVKKLHSYGLVLAGMVCVAGVLSAYNNHPVPDAPAPAALTPEQITVSKLDAKIQTLFLDNSLLREGPKRTDGTRRQPMLGMSRVMRIEPETYSRKMTGRDIPFPTIKFKDPKLNSPEATPKEEDPESIREFKEQVAALSEDYEIAIFGFASDASTLEPDSLRLKYSSSTAVSGHLGLPPGTHPLMGARRMSLQYSRYNLSTETISTPKHLDLVGKALNIASDSVAQLLEKPLTPTYRNFDKIYMEARAVTVSDSSCLKCHGNMELGDPLAIMVYAVSKKKQE